MSFFEFMNPVLFYAPIVFFAVGLMIRHRSITLPALANPSIFAGGAVGERKSEVFKLAGPHAMRHIAPNTTLNVGTKGPELVQQCLDAMANADLSFPIVAKPDTGLRGAGVRPINDETDLAAYLTDFPSGRDVMLQEKIEYGGEVGVFYIRYPGETKGRIFSLTLKYTAVIVGDGVKTIECLMDECPRCSRLAHVYKPRHRTKLSHVLQAGEIYALNFAGSHSRGSIFRNGEAHICEDLTNVFDRIAQDFKDLHFARFDVRFKSLSELKKGKNFSIVEVNGVGAEATHIWDCDMTLLQAYKTLAAQWRHAFAIGALNKTRTRTSPRVLDLFRIWKKELARADEYPLAY